MPGSGVVAVGVRGFGGNSSGLVVVLVVAVVVVVVVVALDGDVVIVVMSPLGLTATARRRTIKRSMLRI